MRDFGKISTTIWNSEKFRSLPTDDGRLLYFYLHTCPHVNSVGCFVLREGYATADLGWSVERYRNSIETLSHTHLICRDKVSETVLIEGFFRFNAFANPKHAKGAIKIALGLPDSPVKLRLFIEIQSLKHADHPEVASTIDTLSKRYPEPIETVLKQSRYTETQTETQTETVDDDSARGAADALPNDGREQETDNPTFRERLLKAIGHDPTGVTANGKIVGDRVDFEAFEKARGDLRLSEQEALDVAKEVAARRNGQEPPNSLKYLIPSMQQFAGARDAAPVTPTEPRAKPAKPDWKMTEAERERERKLAFYRRVLQS